MKQLHSVKHDSRLTHESLTPRGTYYYYFHLTVEEIEVPWGGGKPSGSGRSLIVNKTWRPAWLQRQALSPWRTAVTGRYFPAKGSLGRSGGP